MAQFSRTGYMPFCAPQLVFSRWLPIRKPGQNGDSKGTSQCGRRGNVGGELYTGCTTREVFSSQKIKVARFFANVFVRNVPIVNSGTSPAQHVSKRMNN